MATSPPSRKRPRSPELRYTIPVLKSLDELATGSFWDTFENYRALRIPREVLKDLMSSEGDRTDSPAPVEACKGDFSWKDIQRLFESLEEKDQSTWCVENCRKNENRAIETGIGSTEILGPHLSSSDDVGYCSFLLQHDKDAMENALVRLPLSTLPCSSSRRLRYGPCLWFFFGRNSSATVIEGRPEHTDSVSHDGTWHYQLSGCKTWYLRPTDELLDILMRNSSDGDSNQPWSSSDTFQVDCQEGDVLLVNTRLWWHRTVIPSRQNVPSVSYARDFFLEDHSDQGIPYSDSDSLQKTKPDHDETTGDAMTNVDGLYAAKDIEQGTLIFSENDLPECELHRSSTNPNCEIVELEDGTGAVVSCRDIKAGEFFCVPESSDDDDEEDEDSNTDDA